MRVRAPALTSLPQRRPRPHRLPRDAARPAPFSLSPTLPRLPGACEGRRARGKGAKGRGGAGGRERERPGGGEVPAPSLAAPLPLPPRARSLAPGRADSIPSHLFPFPRRRECFLSLGFLLVARFFLPAGFLRPPRGAEASGTQNLLLAPVSGRRREPEPAATWTSCTASLSLSLSLSPPRPWRDEDSARGTPRSLL